MFGTLWPLAVEPSASRIDKTMGKQAGARFIHCSMKAPGERAGERISAGEAERYETGR
jgi:hypothetical protein